MTDNDDNERVAERAALELSKTGRLALAGLRPFEAGRLPRFVTSAYHLAEADIGARSYLFFVPRRGTAMSAWQIDVHMRNICGETGRHPVLATRHMTRNMAERLIGLDVSFVVPGRHVSVRGVDRTMGTRFDPPRPEESHPRSAETVGAYAQAFLLLQILRGDPAPRPPTHWAREFGIAQTTALKACDELAAFGFCRRERDGTPQPLEFLLEGRDLFLAAMPVMASPVSNVGYLAGASTRELKMVSGETALARRSMLAEPRLPCFAIHRGWPLVSVASWAGMEICNAEDADLRVERWRYRPEVLSKDGLADQLSLFLMFRDDSDERVALAAYDMLEEYWKGAAEIRSGDRPAPS